MELDWAYIEKYIPLFKTALFLTVKLAFWGILLSFIIGSICSIIQYFKIHILNQIVKVYIELSRNTPLLIQLFFLYYGLPKIGIVLDGELCAVIGLAFLGGSYMSEAFRAGLEAVPVSNIEAGKAIGLNNWQLSRYILIPQAITYSVPTLGANCIFLLKETSIFSGIGIMELMNTSRDLIGMFYKTDETLIMLVCAYLIILLPLSIFLTWLERRVRHAEFGN